MFLAVFSELQQCPFGYVSIPQKYQYAACPAVMDSAWGGLTGMTGQLLLDSSKAQFGTKPLPIGRAMTGKLGGE